MAKHNYVVNKDGTGELKPERHDGAAPAPQGDLGVVLDTLVQMAEDTKLAYDSVPNRRDEMFSAAIRQAYVTAGNALDHAFRLTDELRRSERVKTLRSELAEEMSFLGMEGDPACQ
jgi:hypothetical protein